MEIVISALNRFSQHIGVAIFSFLFAIPVWAENPRIHIFHNPSELAESAAHKIVDFILDKQKEEKTVVLGLATGSTPLPLYEAFKKMALEKSLDLSRVITFNLDEYIGLSSHHPQSYSSFMFEHLFKDLLFSAENPRGIKQENIHLPKGCANTEEDLSKEELAFLIERYPQRIPGSFLTEEEQIWIIEKRAEEYEALIRRLGPIDLQILGIGLNGHIGFAEPGTPFSSKTMVIQLTEETRRSNSRFFNQEIDAVPLYAISMGIGTILQAREIWLLATGFHKAQIIAETFLQPVSDLIPSTSLRLHPKVHYFLDLDSATILDTVKNELDLSHPMSSFLPSNAFQRQSGSFL